jgi:hypothetical protein
MLIEKTRNTKVRAQFVHETARVQLVSMHGTGESFM